MGGNYVKRTKDNVDVKKMTLKFLLAINKRLEARGWTPDYEENIISIFFQDEEFSYCYDAIVPIQRTFKPLGWKCILEHYSVLSTGGGDKYNYTWKLTKENPYNLPF